MQDEYTIQTVEIPLRNRKGEVVAVAIIDAIDLPIVQGYRWSLLGPGYAVRAEMRDGVSTFIMMSREILGLPRMSGHELEADHKDHNRLNNTRKNLRAVPEYGNHQNLPVRVGGTSKYRGVSWNRQSQKWHAQVMLNYKQYHLGDYISEEEAAKVASDFRRKNMPYSIED